VTLEDHPESIGILDGANDDLGVRAHNSTLVV
jgi:hypothetical protein